jgi:hypothetical protein
VSTAKAGVATGATAMMVPSRASAMILVIFYPEMRPPGRAALWRVVAAATDGGLLAVGI